MANDIINENMSLIKKSKKIVYMQWLIILGIFTERWYELAILLLVNILIAFFNVKRLSISKNILFIAIIISIYSIIIIKYLGYSYNKFIQQLLILIIFVFGYYNFLIFIDHDVKSLFKKYLKITYFVCLLGLIQFIIFVVFNIDIFANINPNRFIQVSTNIIRVNSIMVEPSDLSTFITPAFIYCIIEGKNHELSIEKRLLIYLITILTFSTVTYVIIIIFFIYRYIFHIRKKLIIPIIIMIGIITVPFLSYISITDFDREGNNQNRILYMIKIRIEDTLEAMADFQNMDPHQFEMLNLSTYATMTNFWVAMNAPLRLTGTGLGTHSQNYTSLYFSPTYGYYGLNREDGYSLANRIFSEFGVIGLILIVLFLFKNFNKNNSINVSIAFLLLTVLIRGGHYTRYGLILYIYIYYFTNKINSKMI